MWLEEILETSSQSSRQPFRRPTTKRGEREKRPVQQDSTVPGTVCTVETCFEALMTHDTVLY
jgi:hypothetical protein